MYLFWILKGIVFIYNSEKEFEETFFFQHNEMPGEHFIFGIMTKCYRYFNGAMMPKCNFYSQFKRKFAEFNDREHMIFNS